MTKKHNKLFPGWKTAAGMSIVGFLLSGFLAPLVLYVPQITSEGYSLGEVSVIFTGQALASMGGNYYIKPVVQRIGLKMTIGLGILCTSCSFLVLRSAGGTIPFFLTGLLAGAGWAFGTHSPINLLITRWFVTLRERIISFLLTGMVLGSGIFTTVQTLWIEKFGWKNCCLLIAVLGLALNLPILCILIRDDPERIGLKPYGYNKGDPAPPRIKTAGIAAGKLGMDPESAFRTRVYYWMVAGFVLVGIGVSGAWSFIADVLLEKGFSSVEAGFFVAVTNWSGCAACLIIGTLSERMDTRWLIILLASFAALGSLLIGTLPPAVPAMTAAIILRSVGSLINNNGPTYVAMPVFGARVFEKVFGRLQAMVCLGQAFSTAIFGQLVPILGYPRIYALSAFLILLGAAAVILGMREAESRVLQQE